jgi:hypothetical protein
MCDFTHFFAASKPITLPQKSAFRREAGNEKGLRFTAF